ncbi:bis(5'-nucleosyl)-tetraphosphatase [Patescibacteria group bacterium]
MPKEKSAGALIFFINKNIEYLVLNYPQSKKAKIEYWDLPKGHIENGETEIDTVKREVKEETGLENIELVDGFKENIKYFFTVNGQTIFKTVAFYLAKTHTKEVRISEEHIGYKWLPFKEAVDRVTFENAKQIIRKANTILTT